MSESDSGVDTGSESNESSSMCVESPPRVDEDKDCVDIAERPNLPGSLPHHMSASFMNLQTMHWSYGYGDYRQHEQTRKIKPGFQRRNVNKWKYGAFTKPYDVLGERKLRKAVISNHVEQVRNMLDSGVDPCAADEKQRTALHFAACHGHAEIGNDCWRPLRAVIAEQRYFSLKMWIRAIAGSRFRPISDLISNMSLIILPSSYSLPTRLLIERGADVNQRDVLGNTPLHLAACTSHIEIVTLLLKAGTDVTAFNNSGRSPLHLAQSKLKLLHMNQSYSSSQLKTEVMRVLEMMQVYLQRSGKAVEVDLLTAFTNRLQHHQTREEVNTDVSDLLSSLSHLSLQKA